jgi:hypothetical protein
MRCVKSGGMTPEKLFHELLGLRLNWEVMASRFEKESGTVFNPYTPALRPVQTFPQTFKAFVG